MKSPTLSRNTNVLYRMKKDGTVTPEKDVIKWSRQFSNYKYRRVKRTSVTDDVAVSTIFLGVAHGFRKEKPLLFETAVKSNGLYTITDRYTTIEDAKKGHDKYVRALRKKIKERN